MTGLIGALVPSPAKLGLLAAPYAALVAVSLIAWHFDKRAVANADLVHSQAASFTQAQAAATQIAQQALAHQNAVYEAKATKADHDYQTSLADARSATDRYIATHRLLAAPVASGAGATVTTAQGGRASVLASLPANPFVAVSDPDVRACGAVAAYAMKAHDWTMGLSTLEPFTPAAALTPGAKPN